MKNGCCKTEKGRDEFMEHIVQFGISVDDEMIKRRIMERAESEILARIKNDVTRTMYENRGYYHREAPLVDIVKDAVSEMCEEHKDEIITMAAKLLAEKLANRKATKEMVSDVVRSVNSR